MNENSLNFDFLESTLLCVPFLQFVCQSFFGSKNTMCPVDDYFNELFKVQYL